MNVLLGLDYGLKRTGLAIGNTVTHTARPLSNIQADSRQDLLERLAPFIKEWQPDALALGLPTHPDGNEHEMTRACRNLALALKRRFGLPVVLVDERYSSIGVGDDASAAAEILGRYLEQLTVRATANV